MRYKGVSFTMSAFKEQLHTLLDHTTKVMWKDLLLCKDASCLDAIDISGLKDDMDGDSLPLDLKVAGGPEAIFERGYANSNEDGPCFESGTREPSFVFQIKFQSALHKFLGNLFILLHLTGGLPMTDRQVVSLRYTKEGDQRRHLFINDGLVMAIPNFRFRGDEPVLRFFPWDVSRLILAYLSTVVPFLKMVDMEPPPMLEDIRGYLFDYYGSSAWITMPMDFSYHFKEKLGVEVDAEGYRDISLAIAEKLDVGLMVELAKKHKI
jgi:hypothetical protein